MPAVIEQKIAGILPEYQGELNAFLDYLLFRQASSDKKINSALKFPNRGAYCDAVIPESDENEADERRKWILNEVKPESPKKKPAFLSVRYRLTEGGANELLNAQRDFDKIDEEMWR